MAFPARFDGQCSRCGQPIKARVHFITWNRKVKGQSYHYDCDNVGVVPADYRTVASEPQAKLAGILPEQSKIGFPQSLAMKYQPSSLAEFRGLSKPRAVLGAILKSPRPCSLLLVGPPGTGKTSMAMAFAQELRAGLIHVPSAELTVDRVQDVWDRVQYYPESGGFWVVVCDEADRMSRQAQIALLSKLDGASALKLTFGGGSVKGVQMPVVWIFTCNGQGEDGTEIPDSFEPRFRSRCLTLAYHALDVQELADYLRDIWEAEAGEESSQPDFTAIAEESNGLVRDALQRLDLELLVQTTV